MPAPLKNVIAKDNGPTTKPTAQTQTQTQPQTQSKPKPVKPISPKKLQAQQWEAPSSSQPTQTRKVNPVAQGLKDGTITPPTKVKPVSPKKLVDDQRREQRALTSGKPLIETPKIEALRNEMPQTSSVAPLTPGSRKPGLPSRNVTEIYRSATDGALNQDLETVLPTRRNIAINNAQNDLLRMERELIKPLWAEYEAAKKAFEDGTGTEDALRSAERAYRNAEAQYTPYYEAFNRLLHSDANEYFLNGDLDEMGTRLDNWDSLIEEGNNALLLAENKVNGLQSAYDSASETLNQRAADLDAAYKALQIAEKAYKGNRNNKSKLSKYQSTWDQFQTALKAFNDSRDALLTADYNLSGAVGEYKAQMLMLGDLSNLRQTGGDTYYKRYIEAHPEVVWGQGIGAQYDETGNLVGHSAALQEIQEKMDQLQADNADGHNTAEIKYYQNVLNSGVAIKNMDSGDFGPAREYYNGVADEAQRAMNEIAARYMESAAPDVMAQSSDLIGFKRIEQDLQQDPEYLAAQVKLQNAQYWLRQIQDREYDLTYDRVFADLPDYADDQLNSLIKAYAEDSGNQHTALTSRQAVLRITLASNGFSEDDINAVFDYAKYKGDAIHQDEVRERWYDWAIGLGKKFAGVDNVAAEGQYAAQFGGAVPEVARQALERARELSGSDDPGVIAATAASWPVAMVNSLASGTGAIDLATQGLANMTGIHKQDPFLGKFAPLNYNTIWQTPYTVSQALGEAQYKRTFDALYGRLGDAEQAEKKAQMYQNWYNLSQSMGQSTVIALMSMAGVPGSLMLLSGSAATQTMQDLHKQGYSDGYAVIGGIVSGFAEYITEEVSIEALMKTASLGARGITGRALWGQLALNLGGQIISEASEEGASDIVNLIADEFGMRLLNGGFSQIEMDALAKTREDPSLSYEDALRASWIDWAKQTGQDIMYGGISGGLMGMGGYAVGEAVGSIRQGLRGSELRANGSLGLIMDQVMGMDEVIARGLRLDPNTAFSNDVQIGRTAQRMRESVVLEGIRDRLEALGEEDITADLLSGINALAADERLTPAESKAIQRSKYGAQVSNELADYVEKRNAERAGGEDNRSTAEWTQGLDQQQESMDAMLNSPESSYAFNVNRVNRLEQQYEKLKADNPDASILNPISDAITKAGADAKVAKRQGQLMAKILSGENLTVKEMKEFDLNNQAVRKVFIERTGLFGMERLNNIAPKLKQAYVNRIVAESKMVQDMQAELGKSNDMLAELQQEKSAKRVAALQRTVQKNVFKDIFETRTRKENNAARAETAQQAMETAASERFTPDMTEQQVADKILQLTGEQVYTRSQFTVMAAAYYSSQGQLSGDRLSTSQQAAVATMYHNYLVGKGLSTEQIRALEDAQNTVQEAKAGEVVLADGMNPLEFNARQRASYEAIQQVAKALGLRVYLYETNAEYGNLALAPDGAITSDNGWYDPNDDTIHLDINAGASGQQVSLFAGAHEITHWFKKHNAEKFEALKNFLFEKYRTLDGGVTLENLINDQIAKAQQQGRTISREVAEEEVVADACETMLTDADVLQTLEELRNTDQTVWEKIVEIIRNIVEKIRAAYEGVGPNTREAKILSEIDGAFDELKTLWAEGVSEAAQRLNEMAPKDLDGNPGPIQYSTRSMVEGSDLTYRESDGAILDKNGKPVKHVTAEQMISTPLGRLVQDAVEFGTLKDPNDAKKQYEFLAELMNQIIETRDAALIWETAGSFMFSAIKANSDAQYGKTIDFTTICKKTQQMVDVMSGAMLELGRGLTRSEVEMAYRKVVEAGEPVPCPVCYVFSRWIGIGGILNDMKQFQDRYAGMDEAELQAFMTGMRERAEAYAEEKIKNAKNPEKKRGDFYDKNGEFKLGAVMSDMKAGPNNRIRSRQEKINLSLDCSLQIEALRAEAEEAARLGVPFKFTEQNENTIKNLQKKVLSETELQRLEREIAELEAELEPIKAYQYLNGTIMLQNKDGSWYKNPDFKPVPDNLLFNLNAGAELAANYPFSWKYRTTRGCSAGKAMLPYSDARVGETIQGVKYNDVKDIYTNAEDNPFLNGDEADRRKVLLEARAKQRLQNLIGGMRYQSTSDFRFEYGSDYLITFMEMQAIGANVQLYTKVIEAVDFLSTMGADCNLSVMPLGNGYVENADGTRTLVFSPVTGINGDAAIEMSRRYDNVQLILVGISDEHIRTALAGTDVTFVIPFHGSGNTVSNIQTLMDAVNEELDITTAKDYSAVQTDHERKDGTKEEQAHWKAMRKLRLDIIMGKAQNLSAAQQALLEENQYLSDLWNRFYVEGVDPKTYKCFLAKNQAEQIFPYEYWDKNSTYDNADVNGDRFQEYCALMGIVPRFSGLDSDGNDLGYGNFTQDKGYWKLLIDRSMYTNVYDKDGNWTGYGKYRDQSPINCTNMKVETLDPKWAQATYGEVMTAANDPGKTNEIVRNVIGEITREVRDGERVDVMHSGRAVSDTEQRRMDEQEFADAFDQWIKDGRPDDAWLRLGTTSDVLQGLGAIESDLYIYGDKINTMQDASNPASYHPEMTDDMIKKLPKILNDPVLILASQNYGRAGAANTRLVIFGSYRASNGQNALAVFDLRPKGNDLVLNSSQIVNSAYTKTTNPRQFVANSEVLYVDEKRADLALRPMAFKMPMGWNHVGSVGTITYTPTGVKFSGMKFSQIATPGQANPNPIRHSARGSAEHDISGVTQGLNFRDPTGELLGRVFDGSKKYETRRYTINKGNGKLAGAFLNKPLGIVQTGAGQAQLVGFWELGDGELKSYDWLKEHAAELGNDGTEFEAKPGEKKWVYPIKWAERTDSTPVTGGNQVVRNISDIVSNMTASNETVSTDTVGTEAASENFDAWSQGDETIMHSRRVTDPETLKFLNDQVERGDVTHTYKSYLEVIDDDGTVRLYAPMATQQKVARGKVNRNVMSNPLTVGEWEESVGNVDSKNIVIDTDDDGNPKINPDTGNYKWAYKLTKEKEMDSGEVQAAYNPYQHSSNVVLNDQFEAAYKRPRLVTYECIIPNSELTSGYWYRETNADGLIVEAKDPVGIHEWHKGVVASNLKNTDRQVYMTRWLMPIRRLSNAEVARQYKEIVDREDAPIEIPFNVVSPGLQLELERIGVPIDYNGTGGYQYYRGKYGPGRYPVGQKILGTEREAQYSEDVMHSTRDFQPRLVLEEGTVNKYLADYAAKSNPNYAQAYITYMSPSQFLDLTTSVAGRISVQQSARPLDAQQLGENSRVQPIFLRINTETGEVEGHEGRHRMVALNREGVDEIPVLLFDSRNKYNKVPLASLTLTGQDFGNQRSYDTAVVTDVIPLSYANREEIISRFATPTSREMIGQKYGSGEILRYSGRAVQTVEEAAKALDEKFGKGTSKNLASLARRFEQRAEAAQKQLELERAQHKAQTKQLKKDLMEAKKVAGKIERASGKALRAANNELNKERRANQRRETELKKKMADLATDSMWARKIAESNGEQLLKEQRRIMQDKFDYATRTDIQWGRRWKQSAVTNARQEERRIARDKLGLQRQILSLPGRAAASEARRFRNKKNRVMMNDDTSVLSPIFRQESDPKIPRNAAQFGRRMQRIQEGFEDVPDKVYRAMVNDVNELDKMAKLETRTDNLSVQVNIVRASGATLETIYRTALVDKSGNVIGDSMENIFLCHDENGKFDEKLQKSLEEYMFHKHNVDRMSLEERAVLRVREFTAAPNRHWLVELSAAELAREAADGNPIVQEYVALLRWANNVKNKAVLPGADNYALSADQSQLVVEQYENDPDMKWVVDKANQIYQWWDQFMRNWAVGASISEESYADMRELYPHYVPTYRVDEGGHAAAVRANPSGLETGEMTKAAKGSTRPLIRLEDQFVRSVQSIVAGSRRNDLVRTLVEELMFDDEGVFSQFGVYDWAGADEATRQTFWDFAQEQDKTAIEKVTVDGKEAYHISCWVDGVKMSAYVNRAMFEGLSSLFGKNRNAGWETIGKIGSKFTAPMKGMITGYNPTFALKNFLRDQQTALANTNNGVAYMAYVAKAAAKMATNDDDWVRFQALGGVSANETRVDGGFAKAMAPKNPVSKAWNKGKELLGLPGELSESVSRFAEYLGTLDRLGGNTYENQLAAIKDAAEITVDFGRHGSVGRLINMWVPYWNANVQGLDKAIRNIKDQPDFIHKVARLGRAMVVNAIPMAIQIALIKHFKREKDYEELSDQVKDNYYCMPIPGKEHKFFKFPKTQDWAVFFSTPILRMWEGVEGRDDKNESWLEAMCSGMDGYFESAVVPQLPFDTRTVLGVENVPVLMPLGLDWMLELAENKNWAGSAIIPYNLQKVSAKEQYDEATSWLAYQFGQIFGASPMQIDYILDDYMGNFWGVAAKSIPIMNPLASRGLYSGELSWQEKNADILQSLASPFITDNRYSNGTMANYYEMVDQLEQEVLDAGAHGDEKTAEHYAIYKALTQTGGYIDQIRALTTEARGMLKGEEQAGIRWDAVGLAAEAMEFVQKSLDGEIQDPILWMTYHKYGDRIMAEAEALKKYESSNDGDFNFSGALGNPKTIYNRSGDVDVKYDLKDNLEAQDMYSQLRAEEYRKQLDIVISSPEYKSLKPTEKAARLEAAKKVALKRADERMLQYLQQNKIQGETIGKADYDTERREAAYSVAWLLGEQNAYKPALTNAFVDLYDYKDQYSFMPADSTKKTFKDPTDDTGSRVYVLNSAQQKRYSEIYHDTITELYDTVMATEEYKAAGTELRAAMLARAKTYYANDLIKERFAEYLTDAGATATTVDKASTEISLEAKYSIQRALGDDNAMGKDVTDELVRLYQYADVGEVEYFPITTAPKSYVDDQHDGQMWVFTEDQRETYMSMMFDIYQRNVRKVMASRQYQQGTDYQKAQMLCEVRARLSGETQAEFKNWLRKNKVPTVSKKSPEAQAVQKDIDAAAKVVDGILGKYRTYKQFSEGRGYTQPKKKKKK